MYDVLLRLERNDVNDDPSFLTKIRGSRQVKSLSWDISFLYAFIETAKQNFRKSFVLYNKDVLGGAENGWELLEERGHRAAQPPPDQVRAGWGGPRAGQSGFRVPQYFNM